MESFKVSYTINAVDYDNKTVNVTVESDMGHKAKIKASASGLLLNRIKTGQQDPGKRQYLGVTFTSENRSPSFDENPLQVQQFLNADGTHKNWNVKLVTERGHFFKRYHDFFGREMKEIKYKHWSPDKFLRFTRWTVNA